MEYKFKGGLGVPKVEINDNGITIGKDYYTYDGIDEIRVDSTGTMNRNGKFSIVINGKKKTHQYYCFYNDKLQSAVNEIQTILQQKSNSKTNEEMTIEAAVLKYGRKTIGSDAHIKLAEQSVFPTEKVFYANIFNVKIENNTLQINNVTKTNKITKDVFSLKSLKDKQNGIVVITNTQVLYCCSIMGSQIVKSIPLDKIEQINEGTGMLGASILKIYTLTDVLEIDCQVSDVGLIKQKIAEAKQYTVPTQPVQQVIVQQIAEVVDDEFAKLRKFKALYDDGLITKEEYEQKKKELLDL